jgi:glycosyltransferase involved in cell wall biosynthesis
MLKVAIIFDNFGPYHLARLHAASTVCDLLAIEVAGKSGTYAWESESSAGNFRRVTLVEKATSADLPRVELIKRLERALDEFQPATVVVPGWASLACWGAIRWCLARGVPMVCLSDSTEWDEPRTALKEALKSRLVTLFSSALVAGKRAADYITQLGMARDRVYDGFDVVDNDYFSAQAREVRGNFDAMRLRHALPQNYFLASARFVAKKNLPRLLEAYALYRGANASPWSLVLLGDGPLRPELEQQRAARGLGDSLLMPGFKQIADLPAHYALAGAFILPSIEEPWGLVVNEAMASGLPVLVSQRCGCVPELVHDGVNGFAFDPLDPADLARRMTQISSPDFPADTFRQASAKIIAEWTPERFAQGLAQAVTTAMTTGTVPSTFLQRAILALLLRR